MDNIPKVKKSRLSSTAPDLKKAAAMAVAGVAVVAGLSEVPKLAAIILTCLVVSALIRKYFGKTVFDHVDRPPWGDDFWP